MQTLLIILAALSGGVMIASLSWPLVTRYRLFQRKRRRLEAIRAMPRYRCRQAFLDSVEKQMLQSLSAVVGKDLTVYPKVRLASLLQLSRGDEQANPDLARFIRDQVVDYVICDAPSQHPVLAVMLHNSADQSEKTGARRQKLEDFLSGVGLPLLPITRQSPLGSLQTAQSLQSALTTFVKQQANAA